MKTFLLLLMIAVMAAACSSDGGGDAAPAELTTRQKVTIHEVMSSYNDVEAVLQGSSRELSKLKSHMTKAFKEEKCEKKEVGSGEGSSSDGSSSKLSVVTINGAECPITYEAEAETNNAVEGEPGFTAVVQKSDSKLKRNYSAVEDTSMYEDTHVVSYLLTGSSKSETRINKDQNLMKSTFSGTFGGKIRSREHGEITVSMTVSGESLKDETDPFEPKTLGQTVVDVTLTFPEFTAIGHAEVDSQDPKKSKYTVNGSEATRAQYEYLFGGIGMN